MRKEPIRTKSWTLLNDLPTGDFIAQQSKSCLSPEGRYQQRSSAIAFARSCIRSDAGGRFHCAVDLVNCLDIETRIDGGAVLLSICSTFVVLDELQILPLAHSSGQFLFDLLSRLYKRTCLIVTTTLQSANDTACSTTPR